MTNEVMIKQLRKLRDKHKNDNVMTFETNWSCLCEDVANRIEELEKELLELKEKHVHVVKKQQWMDTECVCGKVFSVHHGDGYHSIPYAMKTNYCPECGIKLEWEDK